MTEKQNQDELYCGQETYEIRIKGHLQDRWAESFECMVLIREDDGTTTLQGRLPDQTALHGILLRIRNMNLQLISFRQIEEHRESNDNKD